ncbi:DUF2280 domain-containing protein [Aureimonas sp. Leaf427]|uniref:DUF2280 domain-containing protein n=1 Tax=Aureimonas sp. Leaf427 TaxID=1736375 RepID=UPI0007105F58|nr:DUF2280 domain-containing protein [Aureimonas sp. Leaf427]KQT52260.1 hypothetical protein ASG62_16525 [Aureimonas sp. Leaf427]
MAKGKLTDEVRTHIVQGLACFDSPSVVAASVKKEFDVTVSPQAVEAYDPTKRAGRNLSEKWRTLFEAARTSFVEDTARIGISHRAVRLRALQRMAEKAEDMRNLALAAQLLEQAAKEMGEAYSNRHRLEHTGKNGGPIEHAVSAKDMTDDELARIAFGGSGGASAA